VLTVQKVAALQRIELFSGMTSVELSRIAAIAEQVVYSAGSVIFREGDYGQSMFLVLEGEVRLHTDTRDFETAIQNDYFGEMTLIDGDARSASATALSDCLLLSIGQEAFQQTLASNFEAALAIMRTLSQRLRKEVLVSRGKDDDEDY
jgi:CRP/FNR family cyclic AMP-dependent transcriptional regulator